MTLLDFSPSVSAESCDGAPELSPLAQPRELSLKRAKFAYSTRFVAAASELTQFGVATDLSAEPRPGDVVLAKVTEIGHHKRLEGPESRRQTLFVGDEIVVAYGSRYAADQFLAKVPSDLSPCHLAAAGGLAAEVIEQHEKVDFPTAIEPLGLVTKADGTRLNLKDCAPHSINRSGVSVAPEQSSIPVITVLGTSMNSGKSTTLACLAHGLAKAGMRVHVGKATGTGAGNDAHLFTDAGAARVLDFTDFGLSTTFGLSHSEVRDVFFSLVDALAEDRGDGTPDAILVEIADGIFQGETRELLTDQVFQERVQEIVFSAGDALGAVGGVSTLATLGLSPSLVSGVLTASPLATREAMAALDVPVIPTYDLCDPNVASASVRLTHSSDA